MLGHKRISELYGKYTIAQNPEKTHAVDTISTENFQITRIQLLIVAIRG